MQDYISLLYVPEDGHGLRKWRVSRKRFSIVKFVALLSLLILILFPIISILYFQNKLELKKTENTFENDFHQQIQELNQTEESLNNMLNYINGQKIKLLETEELLESLKSEKEILEPIINTQKETVEQILAAQTRRNRKLIWIDRLFGFISGIIASITGTIILLIFGKEEITTDPLA